MTVKVVETNDQTRTIVLEIIPPIAVPADPMNTADLAHEYQKKLGAKIFRILDFTRSELDFSNMIQGMAIEIGRPGGQSDENVTSFYVGGKDELIELGVHALETQQQYQASEVRVWASIDEAKAEIKRRTLEATNA